VAYDEAAIESMVSPGHLIALVALLVATCLLMLTPAVVAGISIVDPSALVQPLSFFDRISPITSGVDYAKLVLPAGSVVMVWRVHEAMKRQGSGR
jgi:hypothetical protein